MSQTISIGAQYFDYLRENHFFYIDKTDFIRQWWENGDIVTLFTRPRRFGKTLNMSMLNCFLSSDYSGRSDLFEGLSIWEHTFYRAMQGTWPVLFLSFAGIKQTTCLNTKLAINELISNLYSRFANIMDAPVFSMHDRNAFHNVCKDMDDPTAAVSIQHLCEWISRFYGKKCIILLDEYDTPLQEAYIHGFWDELADYIRALFNNTFKTNSFLERAAMTGITRVSKESIFSDLNNLTVVTTTTKAYADSFGFTEKEVFEALEDQGLADRKIEVKEWYDGFHFGSRKDIYNPWSITSFLK